MPRSPPVSSRPSNWSASWAGTFQNRNSIFGIHAASMRLGCSGWTASLSVGPANTRVHVPRVFAGPTESLAVHPLHPSRIDPARIPKIEFRFWKVRAHDADQFDGREETGGERGIGSRAA